MLRKDVEVSSCSKMKKKRRAEKFGVTVCSYFQGSLEIFFKTFEVHQRIRAGLPAGVSLYMWFLCFFYVVIL